MTQLKDVVISGTTVADDTMCWGAICLCCVKCVLNISVLIFFFTAIRSHYLAVKRETSRPKKKRYTNAKGREKKKNERN